MNDRRQYLVVADDGWIYDEKGKRLQRQFETVNNRRVWTSRMRGPIAPIEALLFRLETRRDHVWNERLVPMMKEAIKSKAKHLYAENSTESEPGKAYFNEYTVTHERHGYNLGTGSKTVEVKDGSLEAALRYQKEKDDILRSMKKHGDLAMRIHRTSKYHFDVACRANLVCSIIKRMVSGAIYKHRSHELQDTSEVIRVRINGRSYAWRRSEYRYGGDLERIYLGDEIELR